MPRGGESLLVEGLDERQVALILESGFTSAIGHDATAILLGTRLQTPIDTNRVQVIPAKGDVIIAALFTPPSRLAEGEQWTEQILNCPIKWVRVQF